MYEPRTLVQRRTCTASSGVRSYPLNKACERESSVFSTHGAELIGASEGAHRIRKQAASAHDATDTTSLSRLLRVLAREDIAIRNDRDLVACALASELDGAQVDGKRVGRLEPRAPVDGQDVCASTYC